VIKEAERSLKNFLGGYSLRGKRFVDVGCGSGLFSLAAYRLGVKKILSFDFDIDSVKACRCLWRQQGKPASWEIKKGSVLNDEFLKPLGKFDCVYAWGVLHHTGKMWEAIVKASGLVRKGGVLYLAIYNRTNGWGFYGDGRFGTSQFWVGVKKRYSKLPSFIRLLIDCSVVMVLVVSYCLLGKNPWREIKAHPERFRGMSWLADIRDWLGGYPYEYASVAEVFDFMKRRGFELKNLRSEGGLMNNEYLFERKK
jgi:2-polyprenyl-6-hydroxyphenyl methylase/3-demethylubiquinone-9 3-methyltransferase